jgi:hypothetical protein
MFDTIPSRMKLDTLPLDIWIELTSFLDTGDVVSVAQVNRSLRAFFLANDPLWASLLKRMNINYGPRSKGTAFENVIRQIPGRRCQDCYAMELEPTPRIRAFFRRRLCGNCRSMTKYTLITSTKAKKEYRLDNQDLQPLRVLLVTNPYYLSKPPMRLYSLEQIKAVSNSKMETLQTTLEEQKRKSKERGETIKKGKLAAKEQRRNDLIGALAVYGLELKDDHLTCRRFINNNWRQSRWRPSTTRLNLDQVVESVLEEHYLTDHSCYDTMCNYYNQSFGLYETEDEALEFLDLVENEDWDESISFCSCGKRNLQEIVISRWLALDHGS